MSENKVNIPVILGKDKKIEACFNIVTGKFEAVYNEKFYTSTSVLGLKKLINGKKSNLKEVDCYEFTLIRTGKNISIQSEVKIENIFEDTRFKNYFKIDKAQKKRFFVSRVINTNFLTNINYINISSFYNNTLVLKIITNDIVFTRRFLNASMECTITIEEAHKKFKNYLHSLKNSNNE